MKIVFISNSFNHHQKPFCDVMYSMIGDDFCFIETRAIRKERLEMGWGREIKPDYVEQNYVDEDSKRLCQHKIDTADIVIHAHGSAPDNLLCNRLRARKPVFVYSERVFKTGCPYYKLPWYVLQNYRRGYMRKNVYLLCSSAYSSSDFAKTMSFIRKTYKWGYFPQTKVYDMDELFVEKRKNKKVSILWAGRFLEWKHPEIPILIAEKLKGDGYAFDLNMIGSGDMGTRIRRMVAEKELHDCVHFLGTMSPEQVRGHMENAEIYLFTSDFNEGWGAVLNESMNSACAVVASHAIGAVPFMIEDTVNGFIYQNGDLDSAYRRIVQLVEQPELREKIGRNAYQSILECWNAKVAAERLLYMADTVVAGKKIKPFEEGPCSSAKRLANRWYKSIKHR